MSEDSIPTLTSEIIAHPAVKKIAVNILGLFSMMISDMGRRSVHRI
jgi:hypothetical protein